MKRFLLSILFFVGVVSFGFGQTTFTATQNGFWNDGATWGSINSPGVAGVDYPGAGDDVVLQSGITVTCDFFTTSACRNIRFPSGGSDMLDLQFFSIITVSGTIYNIGGLPTGRQIIDNGGTLTFTGASTGTTGVPQIGATDIIALWNSNSILPFVNFNLSSLKTIAFIRTPTFALDDLIFSSGFTLNSGTLQLVSTQMRAIKVGQTASVTIESGAVLNQGVPLLSDNISETRIQQGFLNGELSLITTSSYANFVNLNMGANGKIRVGFSGVNQTRGWWFQNVDPTNFNTTLGSEIIFSANANQNILARNYSNSDLLLQSGGTKTLVGLGALELRGNLDIAAGVTFTSSNSNNLTFRGNVKNDGSWNTSQVVIFAGTSSQIINGSSPINFNNEFRVNKSSGSVTLQLIDQIINGDLQVVSGTFRPLGRTVTLAGNIINDGTIEATQNGVGGFIFNGTTEISSPGGTGVTQFRNVTINNAATLTQAAGSQIEVTTNFTNNGTFTHNDGIVRFRQNGIKSISGGNPIAFYDLAAEGGTLNINGTVDLENVMTFAGSPTVDFDGSTNSGVFTVKSTATRDGAIGNTTGATINGNITVERYFTEIRAYRYLGSPVTNTTVADWQEEFPITGTFSNPSTGSFDGTTLDSTDPSLFYYDAAASKYERYPPTGTNSASTFITNGRGYSAFVRNSISNITGAVRGILETGNATMPVAFNGNPAESWNLVANPYASPIDWDAATGWTKTNVADEVHIPLTSSGAFATYIGGASTNGGSRYIASGQAFWIRTNAAAPALATTEAVKSAEQNPVYFRTAPLEIFKIKMLKDNLSDEIAFVMRDDANFGYDEQYDAGRRLNIGGFGYTLSTSSEDGRKLKINSIPKKLDAGCSISIPITMESVTKTGDFTLAFSEVSNLLNYYEVSFIDNFKNEIISIDSDLTYDYVINTDPASKAIDRFTLVINNKEVTALTDLGDKQICSTSEVTYSINNLNQLNDYLIYQGQEKIEELSNQTSAIISITDNYLQSSNNDFEIYGKIGSCDSVRVGDFSIITINNDLNLEVMVVGSNICPDVNQATFQLNTENSVNYTIISNSDTIQTIIGDGSIYKGSISSKILNAGINTFDIFAEKNECAYGNLNQKLEIVVDEFTINESIQFETNDICIDNTASIDFIGQSSVTYSVYKEETLITNVDGDGTNQSIGIDKTELTTGSNEFTIIASYGSCSEFEFSDKVIINVEEEIVQDLEVTNANSCASEVASVIINNAQNNKTYKFKSGEEIIVSKQASQDGELIIEVPATSLTAGMNRFDVLIEGQNCTSLNANQVVEVNYVESAIIDQVVDYTICLNETLTIDLSANVDMKNYQLFLGEELIAETNESKISISPEETTTYTLMGSTSNSCEVNSINFTVNVNDISKPGILASNNLLESSIEGEAYQWYLNGELLQDETNKLIVVSEKGDYAVVVTQGNCSATSDIYAFDQEVLKSNELLENSIKLHPNPVLEKMFIDLSNINSVNITIFTLEGKFIDSFKLEKTQTEIDMTKYSNGTYLMQFESEKGNITKRIVKQ